MNPIYRREFFARWRDRRSHLLLFSLCLVLGLAAYRSYSSAIQSLADNYHIYAGVPIYAGSLSMQSLATRTSRAGHSLFTMLAVGNVAVWFVLAPLLLATGVAREREKGLLEALQLSPMRPASQVIARALSALSFLAALQLVTLPIYFLAFTFGGVSELEILRVWAIVATSAFCGVGLGIALSAQSPRPSGALFGAVTLLVVWSILSFILANFIYVLAYLGLKSWVSPISGALYFCHPIQLVWSLCEPNSVSIPTFAGISRFSAETALPYMLSVWMFVGTLGLVKATRDVTRPLPPLGWAGRNNLIQKWKTRREARLQAQLEKKQKRAKVSVEGALLADLPFDRLIRFKDPLLNREVKSRFRLRRASPWVWTGRTIIFLILAALWIMVFFFVFFDPSGRPSAVPMVLWGEWLLGLALVGTFAASAFAREREAGTWEGVRLSLVTPAEITRTKWASPLIAYAFLTSPLWLFLFVLCPIGTWNGVPLRWIALGVLLISASLGWVSALGCWISVRAKNTAIATCWTIGVPLVSLGVMPYAANYFQVTTRIANRFHGFDGRFLDEDGAYQEEQYLSVYAKETGIQLQNPYTAGRRWSFEQEKAWSSYYNWLQQKRVQVRGTQSALDSWSPVNVITALQDRGRSYGYTYSYLSPDDDTVASMAVIHIALASIGTFILLLGVYTHLKKRID